VNPVLREGNSDRRAPQSVKNFAKKHPHRLAAWDPQTKARVVTMAEGDFYGNEQSVVLEQGGALRIELVAHAGTGESDIVLADGVQTLPGEIVDATFMSAEALRAFYRESIETARAEGLLLSLHLKATMMKVSDPVLFGHAVSVFYEDVFAKHAASSRARASTRTTASATSTRRSPAAARGGPGDRGRHPGRLCRAPRPGDGQLRQGHHQPARAQRRHHRRLDAVVIRDGGQMWNAAGGCSRHPRDDPRPQLRGPMYRGARRLPGQRRARPGDDGLGAQRRPDGAEGRGVRLAPDKTFVIPQDGEVRVVGPDGAVLMSPRRRARATSGGCRVRTSPSRTGSSSPSPGPGSPAPRPASTSTSTRAHDRNVIAKVERYLGDHDLTGLEYRILAPVEAIQWCLERIRQGQDTISVTGNVLRDYLTDLFPILELGTSAKMLSVVPLLNGGGLFETGAGGSAPKHVQQFVAENYLRWDSLGEFSALGASLEHLAQTQGNPTAQVLADALDKAIATFLDENKSRRARSGRSTTAARTSTWRFTGPRSWPPRPPTRPSQPASPRWLRRCRRTRPGSTPS
jgi:isocitrate dehydrogenase